MWGEEETVHKVAYTTIGFRNANGGQLKGSYLYYVMFLVGDIKHISFVYWVLTPSKHPNVFFYPWYRYAQKNPTFVLLHLFVFLLHLEEFCSKLYSFKKKIVKLQKYFILKLQHERKDFWLKHAFQRVPYILWLCSHICKGLRKWYSIYKKKCDGVTLRAHFPLLLDWPIML